MKASRWTAIVAAIVLCAGCGPGGTGQSQELRFSDAQVSYTHTTELADAVLSRAREVYPELTFKLNYKASRDDTWGECGTDVPGRLDIPEWVSWHAIRETTVEPAQGTTDLVLPIVQAFVDDGWEITRDSLDASVYANLQLSKDGFTVGIIAASADKVADGALARFSIGVSSPCLESPDDLADFDPDDPESYFGPGSAPTVGPYTPLRTLAPWEYS